MRQRAGQVWELDTGLVLLVLRSYPSRYVHGETEHDVLILRGHDEEEENSKHQPGTTWQEWRESIEGWEWPSCSRKRIA